MAPPKRFPPNSTTGTGGLSLAGLSPGAGGAGESVRATSPESFFAVITGQPNPAANAYSYVRVDDSAPPAFPAFDSDNGWERGDGVALAAYEVTGNLSVPTDGSAVVKLDPLRLAVGYGFTYAGGAAGGGFTLQDNETPTPVVVPGVTTLTVDYSAGFRLTGSTPAAAVSIAAATLTQAGIVTTAFQEFGGVKKFTSSGLSVDIGNGEVSADSNITSDAALAAVALGNSRVVTWIGNLSSLPNGFAYPNSNASLQPGGFIGREGTGIGTWLFYDDGYSNGGLTGSGRNSFVLCGMNSSTTGFTLVVAGQGYSVSNGSAVLDGVTGTFTVTDASGAHHTVTITGGIVTNWV